jgi:hypothetical protein
MAITFIAAYPLSSPHARNIIYEGNAKFGVYFSQDGTSATFNDATDNFVLGCDQNSLFYIIITTSKKLSKPFAEFRSEIAETGGFGARCIQDSNYIACHGEFPASLVNVQPKWGTPANSSLEGNSWNLNAQTVIAALRGIRPWCQKLK